ncbi:MAG: xanthine dehydrogenase family protein molybdopterin-binding subunit, partial [Alphaproteobacteria bacterium]|nr:xanthine dehydrogenase family protein molybdopterin-binding subunit [Alphaproteobacteria bacterium]
MTETGIGAAVRRTEDQRFLTGNGNYTDDINVFGQTYAAFVRSPHAHAKINGINSTAAAAADGVVAILTGEELAADGVGPLICGWNIAGKNGVEAHNSPVHHALAMGKVNYVGDHVALVVAETQAQADSAAEMVEVDYEE